MKKSKLFAPFLMLSAGAIVSIVMYIFHYNVRQMLPILFGVLLIFYCMGLFIQKKVETFIRLIKEKEAEEGEVIEKEAPVEENNEDIETDA